MSKWSAQDLSEQILARLCVRGVEHFVISPGSRSQGLALAAAQAERAGIAQVHVCHDERQAGFLALGIAKASGKAAAVIVTSGTAVANLLPAALEASASRTPIIFLTADRPPELHGIRSNQTVRQHDLFRNCARVEYDISQTITERKLDEILAEVFECPYGLAHLNVRLREPLSEAREGFVHLYQELSEDEDSGTTSTKSSSHQTTDAKETPHNPTEAYCLSQVKNTVIIAGSNAPKEAEEIAHRLQLPLLAEAVSSVRYGRNVIVHYERLLEMLGEEIERVIVYGHPTLTRAVPRLLARTDIEQILVDPLGYADSALEVYNPSRTATLVPSLTVSPEYNAQQARPWLHRWLQHDSELQQAGAETEQAPPAFFGESAESAPVYTRLNTYARTALAEHKQPLTRELVTHLIWNASWPHDQLVIAASRLVRILDRNAQPRPVTVYANRGLAGIDGTIATALGIHRAHAHNPQHFTCGTTRLLIGDLAFLHDVGSLHLDPGHTQPHLHIFVVNDHGGTIFDDLEVAETARTDDFLRVVRTPHTACIADLAHAYGWKHTKLYTRGQLREALETADAHPHVFEIEIADTLPTHTSAAR